MWTIAAAFAAGAFFLGTETGRTILGKLALVAVVCLALVGAVTVLAVYFSH